jgi:hypothetical protein
LRSVEKYDAVNGSWSSVADMVHQRFCFSMFLVNGQLTAVGGDDEPSVEQYDAATDTWSIVPAMQMPTARNNAATCIAD